MAFKIKLTPAAGRDLQNAVDWEESRNPGLGKKCFNDIEQRLFDIIEIPAIGSVRYDDIRCVTTKTFDISFITELT